MNIPDHISESLKTIFGLNILKFFDVDPDPGSGIDPGSGKKKFGSGINIPDPQIISNFLPFCSWLEQRQ